MQKTAIILMYIGILDSLISKEQSFLERAEASFFWPKHTDVLRTAISQNHYKQINDIYSLVDFRDLYASRGGADEELNAALVSIKEVLKEEIRWDCLPNVSEIHIASRTQ